MAFAFAPASLTETQMFLLDQHTEAASEIAVAIGNELDVAQIQALAPLEHHEGIVNAQSLTRKKLSDFSTL